MWAFIQNDWLDFDQELVGPLPPITVREVRWWWRSHGAAPYIHQYDVWLLAWRFVWRELEHEYLGMPLDQSDLEAHLAFKPWVGRSFVEGEWVVEQGANNREAYLRAIYEGIIPYLRRERTQVLGSEVDQHYAYTFIAELYNPSKLHPVDVLPSQTQRTFALVRPERLVRPKDDLSLEPVET